MTAALLPAQLRPTTSEPVSTSRKGELESGASGRARRNLRKILSPFDTLAARQPHMAAKPLAAFECAGQSYSVPRYLYQGPPGGGETIRLGIFATIHGDEPEGVLGLARLLEILERDREIAQGYALFLYPICNPTGFEDNTRENRPGVDLNRKFWQNSEHPEVRVIESEIWMQAFDGIITLHSDDTSNGLYGFVRGHVLSEALLRPALLEAGRFLPRNHGEVIDGFPARSSVITEGYPGMLQSTPGLEAPPFEITLETPQRAPLHRQVEALAAALKTILVEYRYLQAIAINI